MVEPLEWFRVVGGTKVVCLGLNVLNALEIKNIDVLNKQG